MSLPTFVRAPIVLLVTMVLLAVLFGPLSTAIEPLFEVFLNSEAVTESDVVSGGMIERIESVLFVQGPLVFIGGMILFVILAALRLEGVLR